VLISTCHRRAFALLLALFACGNPMPAPGGSAEGAQASPATARSAEAGEAVVTPFAVRGELDGLLLVWFDEQGTHTASRRSEVPEAHRKRVRIDALNLAPGKRLDPEHVYVADLSAANADGNYPVRKHTRAWFDAQVLGARPAPASAEQASASGEVTIYMASWCGACRSAAGYLRSRNVEFSERDVEKDAAANSEMLRKARAAGKNPSGVPVIDFRGQIILGFDRAALARLIDQAAPI
jgi:glutaredoxin